MSVKLSLDAPALRELLLDADFELELRTAVVAEVVRNTVFKDTQKIAEVVAPDAYQAMLEDAKFQAYVRETLNKAANSMRSTRWGRNDLTPETRQRVDDAVKTFMDSQIERIAAEAQNLTKSAADKALVDIEKRIDKRVARITEDHINREVNTRVAARLSAVLRMASDEQA
jgi:hypothetical protein